MTWLRAPPALVFNTATTTTKGAHRTSCGAVVGNKLVHALACARFPAKVRFDHGCWPAGWLANPSSTGLLASVYRWFSGRPKLLVLVAALGTCYRSQMRWHPGCTRSDGRLRGGMCWDLVRRHRLRLRLRPRGARAGPTCLVRTPGLALSPPFPTTSTQPTA